MTKVIRAVLEHNGADCKCDHTGQEFPHCLGEEITEEEVKALKLVAKMLHLEVNWAPALEEDDTYTPGKVMLFISDWHGNTPGFDSGENFPAEKESDPRIEAEFFLDYLLANLGSDSSER